MKSMTGYGRGEASDLRWEVSVELKSVNHRFLDIACRLPRTLAFLENPLRAALGGALVRGHVEAFIAVRRLGESSIALRTDLGLAQAYLDAARELQRIGAEGTLSLEALMQMDGVLQQEEAAMDEEAVTALFSEACRRALDQLVAMRSREGQNLAVFLGERLDAVAALRERILGRAPAVAAEYREKLSARLAALSVEPVDPVRLAQEIALYADRCDITEELARLDSHIAQFRGFLAAEGETGKKLDFLLQEMNREANTIGSKANDAQLAQWVVALKSELEKLREQVQNVE